MKKPVRTKRQPWPQVWKGQSDAGQKGGVLGGDRSLMLGWLCTLQAIHNLRGTMQTKNTGRSSRRGPVSWNRWRADNPEVKPDLTGADFAGADLTGARVIMTGRV